MSAQTLVRAIAGALEARASDEFLATGLVKLRGVFAGETLQLLRTEIEALLPRAVRRDLLMAATGNSARKMSTIGGQVVKELAPNVASLYRSTALHAALTRVAGRQVYPIADPIEDVVVNILHELGDTHGAHVDTYAFALTICIEAPPANCGGVVEFAHARTAASDLDGQAIERLELAAGDAYFMGTSAGVHRVSPLAASTRRIALTMAYADEQTREARSYSSSILYG